MLDEALYRRIKDYFILEDINAFEKLLLDGFDIHCEKEYLLRKAYRMKKWNVAKYLLSKGANVNVLTKYKKYNLKGKTKWNVNSLQ